MYMVMRSLVKGQGLDGGVWFRLWDEGLASLEDVVYMVMPSLVKGAGLRWGCGV